MGKTIVTMIKKLKAWLKAREEGKKLESWFFVTCDSESIYRHIAAPRKEQWNDKFRLSEIERIYFEATDYMFSDDIHFFITESPASYVIPTEAKGGQALWNLVMERRSF
ncbi:hypothetical protein [Microbulbifer sp. THAF38]|uniref:hypothetical protein n=1 Tax=Microbulbifer sp. THAF38 TaxID=2587856 RepID=UPI001268AA1A|nr:hypothetical protein [Microbulbifer sp. THAF38]QFT55790.1 hypothetical protein FIU95_14665 [Microbulbifer sp. THAF38]